MGSKSGDKKGGGGGENIQQALQPIIDQQMGQSGQVFGATSPLLGGISAQFMNMLGIPYQSGGGQGATGGFTNDTPGNPGGYNPKTGGYTPTGTQGGGQGYGSLLPNDPGTGIADLSQTANVHPQGVVNYANQLDKGAQIPGLIDTPNVGFNSVGYDPSGYNAIAAQLFDPSRAGALANQFTALPDNVSQFGAAKDLAESQFSRASQDALSMIGGAGGSGAINSTIGQLASDRASGLAQVFAQLAANEGLARERGFDRGIGIESGNMNALNNIGMFNAGNTLQNDQFNAGNTLANSQFNSLNQLGSDQFNASNDIGASQILADMQFRSDQANIDRSLATLQNRTNTKNQINQNNIDRAIGIATGGTGLGMQGLQGAGSLAASSALGQANLAQNQNQFNANKKNQTGQSIGTMIALSGCWVARLVYGTDRWILFRAWLITKSPNWFARWYWRHGASVAKWLENKRQLQRIVRALMNSRIAGEAWAR
jgi:hypothetical protein